MCIIDSGHVAGLLLHQQGICTEGYESECIKLNHILYCYTMYSDSNNLQKEMQNLISMHNIRLRQSK